MPTPKPRKSPKFKPAPAQKQTKVQFNVGGVKIELVGALDGLQNATLEDVLSKAFGIGMGAYQSWRAQQAGQGQAGQTGQGQAGGGTGPDPMLYARLRNAWGRFGYMGTEPLDEDYEYMKARYRQLVKLNHPDTGGDESVLKAITADWDLVKQHSGRPL